MALLESMRFFKMALLTALIGSSLLSVSFAQDLQDKDELLQNMRKDKNFEEAEQKLKASGINIADSIHTPYSSTNDVDNLTDAIALNDMDKVKEYLAKGVNPSSTGSGGSVPLMEALSKIDIFKLLIDHGADVNYVSQVVPGLEMTVLGVAITNGNMEAIKILLEKGADVNKKDSVLQQTYLMEAVKSKNVDLVKLLVNHGSDINAKNALQETALTIAQKESSTEIIEFLKSRGAN